MISGWSGSNQGTAQSSTQRGLACDLDSTLWPFNDALREAGGGAVSVDEWLGWSQLVELCGGERMATEAFERAQGYDSMRRFGLFTGVRETFAALEEGGVRVVVVTNRSRRLADDAARFLTQAGLRCSVCALSPSERISFCLEQGIRVIVDDRPQTLESAHDAGLTAIALRYPYNGSVVDRLRLPHATEWSELSTVIFAALRIEYRGTERQGPDEDGEPANQQPTDTRRATCRRG